MLKPGRKGKRLIKPVEGLHLTAYQDADGIWTVGWGHTATARMDLRLHKMTPSGFSTWMRRTRWLRSMLS